MHRTILTAAAVLMLATPALADDFYRGKTVTIITSTGSGGSYDAIARAISRHMSRHLDGKPNMIVQNMPGGGNLLATNHMYNIAAKDGTALATINNAVPLHQVLDGRGVRFDARKFNWIGSTGNSNSVTFAWHTAGVKSIKDLMTKEVILGGTGPASSIVIFPAVMNNLLGTKFKIVTGYKSSSAVDIALERGEVQARSGSYESAYTQHPHWINEKKVVFLVQVGARREKTLPDVPLMTELARNDQEREVLKLVSAPILLGRPYLAPPGVDAARVAQLRKAFADTMADAAFLAETKKLGLDIQPMTGEEVAKVVDDTINAAPDVVAQAKKVMPQRKAKKKKKKSE
jgi:tripartite-type tricarboxylate transporter receptor subunit TctC